MAFGGVVVLAQDDAGGGGASAGVAILLLVGIVMLAVWAFRKTTRSADAAKPTFVPQGADLAPPASLRIAAWSLMGASLLGLVLPVFNSDFGSDGRLSEAGGETIFYFIVAWVALTTGGIAKSRLARGAAIAQGTAIAFGGYLLFVTSVFWATVYLSDGIIGAGAGVAFLSISVAVAIWLIALRMPPGVRPTASPTTGWSITLLTGGVLTALGAMLPPNDSGRSFRDINFDWDPALLQITWLLFIASFLAPAILAFRDGSPIGLGLATGALAPTAWLALTTLIDSDDEIGAVSGAFNEAHPLFLIGAIVQAVAVAIGYSAFRSQHAHSTQPALATTPSSSLEPTGAGIGPESSRSTQAASGDQASIRYDTSAWSTDQLRAIRDRLSLNPPCR